MLTPLVLALLPLVATAGEGVHAFDDAWERTIPFDDAALMRGTWARDGGVLRMAAPPPLGDGTWLANVDVEDGLVRARFIAGEKLDVTLLVRAGGSAGPDADFETGYGVAIEPARGVQPALLRLYRYEHRQPRLLGAEAKLDNVSFAKGTLHELVVTLTGPFIDATLFDGVTLEPRARVIARDRLFAKGRVGVRFARSQDVDGGVSMLAVGAGPHDLAARDEGAGPERLVIMSASQEVLLPSDLKKLIVLRPPGEIHVVTDPTGLERIRRARIEVKSASSDLPWKYVDASLRKTLGRPPTPTSSGLKIDEGYKDNVLVEEIVRAYAARFPHLARVEQIGTSLEGRAIVALKISKNPDTDEDEPALLLDGAHHGGELISTELALDAVQQLLERYRRDPAITRIVDNMAVWIVPVVNPDCLHRFVHFSREADRKNARDVDGDGVVRPDEGIDLYRNYPVRHGALGEIGSRSWPWHSRYRGTAPASEPEVQAMMALAERERFVASVDFHTNATQILVPYTDPGMTNPEPNEAWTVAEEIAAPLPVQTNGKKYTVSRNLYPVDGTAQDWFRFAHGTIALLIEAPTHNPQPYAKGRAANVNGTRGAWLNLATRVLDGPGIAGRVRDAEGNALAAEVIIEEMKPRMGEVWTARPRDGRFHRLLPALGVFTVRVRAPGFVDVTRRVTIDAARTARVDVTLQRTP